VVPFRAGRGTHARLGCLLEASPAVQTQQAGMNRTHKGFAIFREARFLLVCTNDSGLDLVIPRQQADMIRGHMVSHVIMLLAMDQLENGIPIASLGELCEPEKALQTNPRVSKGTSCDAQSVQLGDHRCPEAVEVVPARAIRKDWPGLGHFELGGRRVAELAFEAQKLGG